jgi:hypothetical protein
MTQAISAQPGRTSGTVLTAIDVVRLSLVQLKGGSPQAPLPNGVARVAQNLTPPVFAGQGPVGQTPPVQQAALQAAVPATAPAAALATTHATTQATTQAGVQNSGVRTGAGSLARDLAAAIGGPRTLPANNRPAVGGVFVESRSPQASAILQSHGMIAGLLRTDVILQVTDRSYKDIDGRLSRMQDLARRAASGGISAETRALLEPPFQQLKQEVRQLALVAQPGAEAIVTYVANDRAAALPVSPISGIRGEVEAIRLSLPALPVTTLVDVMLPNVVAGVAVADISEPAVASVAGQVIEKAREGISQVQRIIFHQRTETGSLISQELSRIISLSVQRSDRASAVPALQLSSTVAARMLSPTTIIPVNPGAVISNMDGRGVNNVALPGRAGAPSDHARAVSFDMVSGQPNRTGLIALLSPDPPRARRSRIPCAQEHGPDWRPTVARASFSAVTRSSIWISASWTGPATRPVRSPKENPHEQTGPAPSKGARGWRRRPLDNPAERKITISAPPWNRFYQPLEPFCPMIAGGNVIFR